MILDIVILAAGKGSRMKSKLPKVLHPIAGKALLGHVIETSAPLTDRDITVVIGHGAEEVKASFNQYNQLDFNPVIQEQQLGTGHAVQQALPYLDKQSVTLILYGDVPLIRQQTLNKLIDTVTPETLGLLTVNLENPKGYGRIIRNENKQVVGIVEQKDATDEQLEINEVNTGIMAVNTAQLAQWLPALSNNNAQGEYYLTDIIALAEQQGLTIETEQPDDEWEVLGVNDRCQQAELERIYQSNLAKELMVNGVTLADPNRFDCRGQLSTGSDVAIDINCVFEGEVTLGDQVSIGANCIIKNSIIGNGTVVNANSIIEDSQVNEQCNIGPYARLRPGTVLNNKAKIGNFVETKKAVIGNGSKVNHLSYIGDATLGDNVNIGAGTITCNYDGVNKHKTTIGDDVFVGSNSALVAPITLEKGATIGAGSTINKSVKKETLSLTRSPQKTIKDWQRPIKK